MSGIPRAPTVRAALRRQNRLEFRRSIGGQLVVVHAHSGLWLTRELVKRPGSGTPATVAVTAGWFAWCNVRPTHQVTCVFVQPDEALREPQPSACVTARAYCRCSMRLRRPRRYLTADQPCSLRAQQGHRIVGIELVVGEAHGSWW